MRGKIGEKKPRTNQLRKTNSRCLICHSSVAPSLLILFDRKVNHLFTILILVFSSSFFFHRIGILNLFSNISFQMVDISLSLSQTPSESAARKWEEKRNVEKPWGKKDMKINAEEEVWMKKGGGRKESRNAGATRMTTTTTTTHMAKTEAEKLKGVKWKRKPSGTVWEPYRKRGRKYDGRVSVDERVMDWDVGKRR